MKIRSLSIVALAVAVLFLSGCQTTATFSEVGKIVLAQERVPISEGKNTVTWKGPDLSVNFTYARGQGRLDLTGRIIYADSLAYNYQLLRDFRLSALVLDYSGRVIQTQAVATNRGNFDPIPFQAALPLPSSAASISFSYEGTAVEVDEGGGNPTRFWYYPAH